MHPNHQNFLAYADSGFYDDTIFHRVYKGQAIQGGAFDADGNRLGMGGGYYDRHFAARRTGLWRRPALVGVAYGFQRVARIERAEWDVPLDAIVTESDVYRVASQTGPTTRRSSN